MEAIREHDKEVSLLRGYTPFVGYDHDQLRSRLWELVYFLFPVCDYTCTHCWSSETFLGQPLPLDWHLGFFRAVDPSRLSEIKLTGGEPTLFRKLGDLIRGMRASLGPSVPIRLFTSGRNLVSAIPNEAGVKETISNLLRLGVLNCNLEVHLSADEHHAGSLYRASVGVKTRPQSAEEVGRDISLGLPLLDCRVRNFLAACRIVEDSAGHVVGKIKVHCDIGRLDHHRGLLYPWITDEEWRLRAVASEGLVRSGAAISIPNSTPLCASDSISMFVMPGAEFYSRPVTGRAQSYRDGGSSVYLDESRRDGCGACLVGWWNVVDRIFCGGSAKLDAMSVFGRSTH